MMINVKKPKIITRAKMLKKPLIFVETIVAIETSRVYCTTTENNTINMHQKAATKNIL